MKYFVDYGTGAGNFEFEGTLEEAKKKAEEGICYTQSNVTIYDAEMMSKAFTSEDVDRAAVAVLRWVGVPATEDDDVVADYGNFGFYSGWWDL